MTVAVKDSQSASHTADLNVPLNTQQWNMSEKFEFIKTFNKLQLLFVLTRRKLVLFSPPRLFDSFSKALTTEHHLYLSRRNLEHHPLDPCEQEVHELV